MSVSVFYGATAEVDIASGREAGRGGTCNPSTCTCSAYLPSVGRVGLLSIRGMV